MSIVYRLINGEKYGPVRNVYARWEEAGLASRAEAGKVQKMSLDGSAPSSVACPPTLTCMLLFSRITV